MPQFETERPGKSAAVVRAADLEDAVRRAFGVPAGTVVVVGPPSPRDAWAPVVVDGAPAGRVRPHARMRFRRD